MHDQPCLQAICACLRPLLSVAARSHSTGAALQAATHLPETVCLVNHIPFCVADEARSLQALLLWVQMALFYW